MIAPENKIPLDDSTNNDADDQQSQKDIHSNGLDETANPEEQQADTASLQQAYDAAEAAFTLDVTKGVEENDGDEESNIKS